MIPRPPDPAGDSNPNPPGAGERRAFLRYPRRLEMLWQLLGLAPRDLTRAVVFDLSASGVGLVIDRSLPAEALLVLRLPTSTAGWSSHLVRVKRCQEQADGTFRVGCAFVKPLSARQMQGLLG